MKNSIKTSTWRKAKKIKQQRKNIYHKIRIIPYFSFRRPFLRYMVEYQISPYNLKTDDDPITLWEKELTVCGIDINGKKIYHISESDICTLRGLIERINGNVIF